jgi:hypothetical protein
LERSSKKDLVTNGEFPSRSWERNGLITMARHRLRIVERSY